MSVTPLMRYYQYPFKGLLLC